MLNPYTDSPKTNIRIFKRCYDSLYGTSTSYMDKALRKSIYQRYLSYNVDYDTQSPIRPDNNMILIKEHLIYSYDKKPSNFIAVYNHTMKLNDKTCAYCLISPAQEVDHFLPKNEYPEYSFFAQNLLPICSVCNKKRKKKFSTFYNGNIRKNFNLYFDDFVKTMFTYNIKYVPGASFIIVEINDSTTLEPRQVDIIKEHFKHIKSSTTHTLKVEYSEKIQKLFKDELISHIGEMRRVNDFQEFKTYLKSKIELKLRHSYDFLWFDESYISGNVNMNGLYDFLENIYNNLNSIHTLGLEPWLIDSLN